MSRLPTKDILANITMIEACLKSSPDSVSEWLTIRNALRACVRESERRMAEARKCDLTSQEPQ